MEQQNQQPTQEKAENKSSIKTNWKFIAIVVFLAVLVGGAIWLWYEYEQQSFRKPLPVVNEDQACELDTDCVIVETNCSSCECGTSVNKAHQQKYQSQYEKLCKNYRGPVSECAFNCSTLFPRCINNRCALSAEKSIVDTSNGSTSLTAGWQTYRNDEFGFEVRYPEDFFSERTPSSDVRDELRNNRFGAIVVSFVDKTWEFKEVNNPALHVTVIKTNFYPREWLEKYYKPVLSEQSGNILEPPVGYRNVQEVTINGMSILQFDQLFTGGSAKSSVIQKKPDTLYRIMASSTGLGSFPPELYNQILSTFRFVE